MNFPVRNLPASRHAAPLTEDQLRQFVPSIFADAPHESRSERYLYIPTINAVRALEKEGFVPVSARQSSPRDISKHGHAKHMVRFRRQEQAYRQVGDTLPELVLINSHDGSSAYHLMSGLFRLVCLNGMIVSDGQIDAVKVGHTGKVLDKVIEGSFRVIDQSVKALEAPQAWSQIQLSVPERQILAEQAHALRFGDAEGNVETAITPAQMLAPRRVEDAGSPNLWTTFNVIQENAIRGGLTAWGRDANNRPRRTTTRQINGIDQDVKLNKALWTLAAKMAELKAA